MRWLRGLLVADTTIIVSTIFFGLISLVVSFFDSTGRKQAWLAHVWAKSLLAGSGLHVTVEGLEHIDPSASYVYVSNHTSYMDTPVVLANLSSQFRFLAKSGLFKIPLLGTHLSSAGHISVPLGDPRAAVKTMQRAAEVIQQKKISLLIFPEGGRTEDGVLQSFKEGAAYIAIRAGVPIVPMVLIGAREALPYGAGVVLSANVTLRILKPIETAHLALKDRGTVTEHLRQLILNELEPKSEAQALRASKISSATQIF
ncbi:MAG TPA: lysophospholipid acyltransferase family protein [Bryobacteraceae bacterium]|nr:lysophospholipid acyltransferase family protein [Bryobacteraceae bacterium]